MHWPLAAWPKGNKTSANKKTAKLFTVAEISSKYNIILEASFDPNHKEDNNSTGILKLKNLN